jgi:hypothetical protein
MPIAAVAAGAIIDPTTFGNAVATELNNRVTAYAQAAAVDQTLIGAAATDLTGITVSPTIAVGRRYQVTFQCVGLSAGAAALRRFYIVVDGVIVATGFRNFAAVAQFETITLTAYVTGLAAGVRVFKAQALSDAGTVTIANTAMRGHILVEDVGAP